MENKYDVSVVIPVYNNEKYIKECVESIMKQDYDLDKIQIILINDGSKDNSLEICENLAKEYKQIKLINQENQGVSAARNNGIKNAEGKYIMFLDSDDMISKNAIQELIEFFDENYDEIDLLTYPIYNYNDKTKKVKKLRRYEILFQGTGVYDLNKDYDAVQTTINVVVKNNGASNILFDTMLFFHEDLKYNVELLKEKQKVGYVNTAHYYYRKFDNSTTNIKDNPLYSFEQYSTLFIELLDNYKDENGKSLRYVQSIILNTLRWRLEQDKIYPYNMEEKYYLNIIKNILIKIDNDVIANDKQLSKYHKMYLIDLKGEEIFIIDNNNYRKAIFSIIDKDGIISIENKLEIVINRLNIRNDKINIVAYLKSPLLKYCDTELYIEYVNEEDEKCEEKIETSDSNADYFRTNIKVAKFEKFELHIDIDKIKNLGFKVIINEKIIPISFYFNAWVPFNGKIPNYKIYYNDKYKLTFKNNKFYVTKPTQKQRKDDLKIDSRKYKKINKNIDLYRRIARLTRKKDKKIWLYYDRVGIIDNGYLQFKNDISKKDNIKKYYILDGNKKDYVDKFTKEELKYVVKFGSYKHKLLYLNSDKILTSFSSLQEYCPLHRKYAYYKDILKYELVYLQHGILHANLLKMYSKEFAAIDKFVISTEFEKNNLINNYNYSIEDLIPVGMPRLEENNEKYEVKNKIIFAPSWRKYLIGESINRKRKINVEKFTNSKYYIEIIKFLTDKKLNATLKKENLILEFKLHPIFKDYEQCFEEVINENITVSIGEVNLEEYKIFITDFSSFQFDFVKLQRPIIYFMPDMDEFKAGLHTYRELDLPYEEAFGNLCLTGTELVDELVGIINNNCTAEEIYKNRMEKFFYKVDNRKDKLYEILKGE